MLQHRQKVGKDLRGMEFRGQSVPNRNVGVFCQLFHSILSETAVFNSVVHPPQHSGRIFHGFFGADLRPCRTKIGHVSPLVECGCLERAACACGRLFKNESDVFTLQPGLLCARILGFFQIQ